MSTTEMTATTGSTSELAGITPEDMAQLTGRTTLQREREDPDSRHRIYPVGYNMRASVFNVEAIKAAVFLPDGRNYVLSRIRSGFFATYGANQVYFEEEVKTCRRELEQHEEEKRRFIALQKECPPQKMINTPVLPHGIAFWGWVFNILAVLLLNGMALFNAASFFLGDGQQIWWIACLGCTPLLFLSYAFEIGVSKLDARARRIVGWLVNTVGVISALSFTYLLAMKACPPSISEILNANGAASSQGWLDSIKLASQIGMEIAFSCALMHKIAQQLSVEARMIINPDSKLIADRLTAIHKTISEYCARMAVAEGELQELSSSLAYLLAQASTMFDLHLVYITQMKTAMASLDTWPR